MAHPSLDPIAYDGFDLPSLNQALSGTRFEHKLHFFSSISSTNTHAMHQAEAGASDGSVWLADEQTQGRGRGAHAWSSPPGSGLYCSILLRPAIAPADILWLSLAAGLAARNAVRQVTSLEADLRWPNDLLLGSRKFCGILTELNAEVTRVRHAVIGIGINVHQAHFPDELRSLATSLLIETDREWPRQEILLALLQSLDREIATLTTSSDPRQFAHTMRERLSAASSWIRGKHVRVEENGGFTGITEGLDARGFLQVRSAGALRTVYSGGVREA